MGCSSRILHQSLGHFFVLFGFLCVLFALFVACVLAESRKNGRTTTAMRAPNANYG